MCISEELAAGRERPRAMIAELFAFLPGRTRAAARAYRAIARAKRPSGGLRLHRGHDRRILLSHLRADDRPAPAAVATNLHSACSTTLHNSTDRTTYILPICRWISLPIFSGLSSTSCSTSTLKNRCVRTIADYRRVAAILRVKNGLQDLPNPPRPAKLSRCRRRDLPALLRPAARDDSRLPLDCEYLIEARKQETENAAPEGFPNQDVRVTDKFLRDNEELLVAMGRAVLMAGLGTPGAADFDVREALARRSSARQRTLESGRYCDRPGESFGGRKLPAHSGSGRRFSPAGARTPANDTDARY